MGIDLKGEMLLKAAKRFRHVNGQGENACVI